MTRDKDLSQLIRDGDVFWDYSGNARYHYHEIGARFGASPERIADFLALTGDSGRQYSRGARHRQEDRGGAVRGIRLPRRAVCESRARARAEAARRRRASPPGSLAHKEAAYLARRLTGIVCDMPLEATAGRSCGRGRRMARGCESFFDAHGFGNILRQQARRIAALRIRGDRSMTEKNIQSVLHEERRVCSARAIRHAGLDQRGGQLESLHAKAARGLRRILGGSRGRRNRLAPSFQRAPGRRGCAELPLVRRRRAQRVATTASTCTSPRSGDKTAIMFEGEPGDVRELTYRELHREVCRFANALKAQGIEQGRPGRHLHAADPRGGDRHAGVRPHRRHSLGGLRRILRQRGQGPHRGRRAPGWWSPPTAAGAAATRSN